jgi:hypothetical protein
VRRELARRLAVAGLEGVAAFPGGVEADADLHQVMVSASVGRGKTDPESGEPTAL